jgi:trigger factor
MQVEVPEALIEREVTRDVRELETRLQEQLGMRLDSYLQQTNSSLDVLRAERRPRAVQKVRLELALETVAEREGLTVSDAEVDEAVSQAIADDPHPNHQRELRKADPVKAYFRHQLLMRKTIDYLSAMAAPETSDTMEPTAAGSQRQTAGTSASGKSDRPGE